MFDSLSTRLQTIFDRLGGRGRLSEENIQEALREVRVALLEADVNFKVVRAFIDRVKDKAVGQDVLRSLENELGPAYAQTKSPLAARLFLELMTAAECPEWLTVAAYAHLD